ncbi:hypothetical protein RB195_023102 [Necator americanus]|uniref:Cohesin loading complex subunit SCC4 homolog n=1 Tax=Necator americanus TaxID=51031 RepID=A0ABR1EIH7_NECAM
MEIITERLYTNLFRSSTPVSSPIIPIGEALPRILPSEVRVAIKSIKPGTAPDLISYQQTSFGLMAIYFVTLKAQPQEQDGVRQGFSCMDYFQAVSRVMENILDDNGEGTKRVEEMLGPARPVKTGHLNIFRRNVSWSLAEIFLIEICTLFDRDEELSRHAVICHVERVHLYQKLGNANEERKENAIAASILICTFQLARINRSPIRCSFSDEIADLYSKSIKLCLHAKAFRTAGLTSVEATKILMENQQYEMANEHVRKAVRLLEGNSSMCMQALYILVEIHFHMYQWEQLLTDADYLWIHVMKTRPKNVRSRRMLKDLEVFTVLVLQKSRSSHQLGKLRMSKPQLTRFF